MSIETMFIWSIILFGVIYFSVRLAINPLLNKQEELIKDNEDFGLVKLRDIAILSDAELEEVIGLYKNKGVKEEDYTQYKKYEKVLNELKEMGYFTKEQYSAKVDKLKKYFEVD
ncbi:hypothetical protein [Desnuesiella massiliensis]|uniref:hypothetical protein n=1 Tax=Desnuesiella massiliensis TaxID=1650662 RepID=UPI0006E284C1|nr:hypothetical protein [Desnuesiella massiliensis]